MMGDRNMSVFRCVPSSLDMILFLVSVVTALHHWGAVRCHL